MKKIIILLTLFLCACHTIPPEQGTAIDDMHAAIRDGIRQDQARRSQTHAVPSMVQEALLPPIKSRLPSDESLSEHRFNVTADKMPAKIFFMSLVEGTPYNMVVSPNIEGTVTLTLKDVTVDEAMEAVRDVYGYEYRKTTYGYEILPEELVTQIFNVNYLDVQRKGKSLIQVTSDQVSSVGTISAGGGANGNSSTPSPSPSPTVGGASETMSGGSIDTRSEVNFWKDLKTTLTDMVGTDKGHSVFLNAQAGIVTVRAFPSELHRISRYLDRIQSSLQRQVVIEAKILEVTLNDGFESGIDWSAFGNPLVGEALLSQTGNGPIVNDANGFGAFGNTQLQNFDGIFTLTYRGNLRALIRFLQTEGNVQVLSSPRISTVNNQKAVIKVGQDQFFVTGVSTSNTIVGNNTVPTQDVGLTPFFSGVSLDVTPQISRDGTVILHIHPAVTVVTEQQKNITLGNSLTSTPNVLTLPLALSTIRESDNIVKAKSGQVIVIGGLMQNTTTENTAGTPGLSRIPFIGSFFRRTSQVSQKTELIILLRPILVDNGTWKKELCRADRKLMSMKRGFHVGGAPDVFGTEGEM